MSDLKLYGISNCDTVRKARKWLSGHSIDYTFHDFHKQGLDEKTLESWIAKVGWTLLLNRRGTTWRKLPKTERADLDEAKARILMLTYPALIKRPVLVGEGQLLVGFDESKYQEIIP